MVAKRLYTRWSGPGGGWRSQMFQIRNQRKQSADTDDFPFFSLRRMPSESTRFRWRPKMYSRAETPKCAGGGNAPSAPMADPMCGRHISKIRDFPRAGRGVAVAGAPDSKSAQIVGFYFRPALIFLASVGFREPPMAPSDVLTVRGGIIFA